MAGSFNLLNRFMGQAGAVLHIADGRMGPTLQGLYHALYFIGGTLYSLSQGTNLVGDYGKATARLTGPCCFNGCVQSQQVGLLSDVADDPYHTAYLLTMAFQGQHVLTAAFNTGCQAGNGLADPHDLISTVSRQRIRLGGLVPGDSGVAGNILYRSTHLIDCSSNHVSLALLGHHAVLHAAHQACHFICALLQFAGGLAYGADYLLLGALHGIEGPGHGADFIAGRDMGGAQGQIAGLLHGQHDVAQGSDVVDNERNQYLGNSKDAEHQDKYGQRIQRRTLQQQCHVTLSHHAQCARLPLMLGNPSAVQLNGGGLLQLVSRNPGGGGAGPRVLPRIQPLQAGGGPVCT